MNISLLRWTNKQALILISLMLKVFFKANNEVSTNIDVLMYASFFLVDSSSQAYLL